MLVWGGRFYDSGYDPLDTGGCYDPEDDVWAEIQKNVITTLEQTDFAFLANRTKEKMAGNVS